VSRPHHPHGDVTGEAAAEVAATEAAAEQQEQHGRSEEGFGAAGGAAAVADSVQPAAASTCDLAVATVDEDLSVHVLILDVAENKYVPGANKQQKKPRRPAPPLA
jgi:hypothetical protein